MSAGGRGPDAGRGPETSAKQAAVVCARAGAALLCALPWLRAWPSTPGWLGRVVGLTFLPLCHHWAGRVLELGGEPMCVCSRCAGLYAGLAAGFLLPAPALADRTYRRVLTVAIAAMAVDVVTQDAGLHAPWHPARLATGLAVGWALAAWVVRATGPRRSSLLPLQRG